MFNGFYLKHVAVTALVLASCAGFAQSHFQPYKPSPDELVASYKKADAIRTEYDSKTFMFRIVPHWLDAKGNRFWYEKIDHTGTEFRIVDPERKSNTLIFDQAKLAAALSTALGHAVTAHHLPITNIAFPKPGTIEIWTADGSFLWNPADGTLVKTSDPAPAFITASKATGLNQGFPADATTVESPDGKRTAAIIDGNIALIDDDGKRTFLTHLHRGGAAFDAIDWAADSRHIVGEYKVEGDHKLVYNIESSPNSAGFKPGVGSPGGVGRAVLLERPYDLPGDKLDSFTYDIIDADTATLREANAPACDNWYGPNFVWDQDHLHFYYEVLDRGVQRYRLFRVDATTGATNDDDSYNSTPFAYYDEKAKTFIDTTALWIYYCKLSHQVLLSTERDGWRHLYRINDITGGDPKPITTGPWVTRQVDDVDEAHQWIYFQGSGKDSTADGGGESPYFIHEYRVNFDGSGLVDLTPGIGFHQADFSPDHKYLVDTCSTINTPATFTLRSAVNGKSVLALGGTDTSELSHTDFAAPMPFVAKGRDGVTDIYGIAYFPNNFDKSKSYPVIEDIYAGPQDSFVPQTFSPWHADQSLADLGFIVVQMDGMGTRNRSRAFHDVCWQNIKDAGFPDRILWIKALAKKVPQIDLDRVGIFGTSAGGQNSTAALLFHPDFYKVAVSSCGCQDNRMDKVWWNEQWMGYPVGPQYSESSNIDNAYRLKGHLLLYVAELDTNVPPASTVRLVNALMNAGRDFGFLIIPGSNHTDGGPYGERKRRDWFVKYLLHVPAPDWNALPPAPVTRWGLP